MHDTALAIGRGFFELYGDRARPDVVEIGSQDVNGSLRAVLPADASYLGIDRSPGRNVDLVSEGSRLALADGTADLTVTSSAFEHDPLFWMTFLELCRITRTGGFIYINAPSNGVIHRHPLDCWRFYPDAAAALVKWAGSQGYDVTCVESFTAERGGDIWNDYVAVFACGPTAPRAGRTYLHSRFPCRNIRRFDREETREPALATEDERLLAAAIRALSALEARAAEIATEPGGDRTTAASRRAEQIRRMEGLLSGAIRATDGPADDFGPFNEAFSRVRAALDQAKPKIRPKPGRWRRNRRPGPAAW